MTNLDKETDAFSQLDQLTHKRTALESLIGIATSIHRQQAAMEGLAFIARPSQEIPAKTIHQLQDFEQKYAKLADEELVQWLNSIEDATRKVVEKVASVADLEIQALRDNEIKGLSVEGFNTLIADFERRTQTSLTLRYLLKKRGVVLAAFKLPFPQDSIAERVEALKEKETRCIAQITQEAQSILNDTRTLLQNPALPEKMLQQLHSVEEAMLANIQHLEAGGAITEIPHKFEVVIQETDPLIDEPRPQTPRPEAPIASKPMQPKPSDQPTRLPGKKLSTLQLFFKWLTTPMSTSWKQLKRENERKR